jgi:nitrous oxidase accessory protein NosD
MDTVAASLGLLVLVLLASEPLLASTIWVDRFNTGPEDGTSDHPFNTIQEGMDVAVYGDTVLVRPGVYDYVFEEQKTSQHWTVGVNMTDGVTLKSEQGPHITIIDGAAGDGGVFFCDTGTDTRVEGFRIRNSDNGVLLYYCGGDNRPVISGNTFEYNVDGIQTVSGNDHECAPTIVDNTFRDGIGASPYGIRITGQAEHNNHHFISRNTIESGFYTGIFANSKADPLICNNDIHGCEYGVRFYFWCNPEISHNRICACGHAIHINTHCTPWIHSNDLSGNPWCLWAVGYFNGFFTVDAERNYWGTEIEAEIQARIHDQMDDPGEQVIIDYDPWTTSTGCAPGTDEGLPVNWGRIKSLFRGR